MTPKDRLYLLLYTLFSRMVVSTPEPIRLALLRGLGRLIWVLDYRHRHIARVNLDLAFGESLPKKRKRAIIRRTYENLLLNLGDFIAHEEDDAATILSRVTIQNRHILDELTADGKPVILITAHYGNWELLPRVFAAAFGPLSVVGRPLDSAAMNELLQQGRQRLGIELIPKKGALKALFKALRSGRSVGLLVDQNTSENEGILIDFFGKKARHTPAAALLARKLDLPIVPAFIQTEDHRHFTVTIHPPLPMPRTEDMEADIAQNVQAQADVTEQVIREKPDEWFWLHKRWKNQYEELYR